MRAGELGRPQDMPLLGLALNDVAHPLRGAVGGGGQCPVAAPLEQADDLVVQTIGAQAGDADLAPAVDDVAQDLGQPRVVGHRGAHQAHPAHVGGDERRHLRRGDQAHAAVGRATHHAVGAAAVAAALGLDEEHVRELGVRRADLRVGGEQGIVGGGHRGRSLAVHGRDVEPGARRQGLQQRRRATTKPASSR